MSFLSGVFNFAKSAFNFLRGNSIASSLAKTALSAYALNRVVNSINRQTATEGFQDQGVELQLEADTANKIPVVYGRSTIGGNITDVHLANDNLSLWVVLTLCEQTGTTIAGVQSSISFDRVYMDGFEIVFKADAVTADYLVDVAGNQDTRVENLVQVYCYSNGSANQVFPTGYSGNATNANAVMPNWGVSDEMNNLVFAIVKVTYNAEKRITNFPEFKFSLNNTMKEPGDCIYDYMTSSRYGAGIDPSEINS
jgi:hypothetical protein